MSEIRIEVLNKIAVNPDPKQQIVVCGNSDYTIRFDFDAEWNAFQTKTARFAYEGSYQDVVFNGNVVNVPKMKDVYCFTVGVYAGDLHTTTPATVLTKKSVLCAAGVPDAPSQDVYSQIMSAVAGKANAVHTHSYNALTDKPDIPEAYDDTEVKQMIQGKAAANHTHSYNTLTDKPVIPAAYDDTEIREEIEGKADADHVHSYNDLTNKPVIPAAYDDTEVRGLIDGLDEGKADADHVHTWEEIQEKPEIPEAYDDSEIREDITELQSGKQQLVVLDTNNVTAESFDSVWNTLEQYPNADVVINGIKATYCQCAEMYGSKYINALIDGWNNRTYTSVMHSFVKNSAGTVTHSTPGGNSVEVPLPVEAGEGIEIEDNFMGDGKSISVSEEIRAGASAGATALQEHQNIPVKGVKVAGTDLVPDADDKVNVPIATSASKGVIQVSAGLNVDINGKLVVNRASDSSIKNGVSTGYSPSCADAHKYVYYGLGRAAGSVPTGAVGDVYDDAAKSAVCGMIGAERYNNYQLIESFTPTENANEYVKNAEPDGTPYNFHSVIIVIYRPKGIAHDTYNNATIRDGNNRTIKNEIGSVSSADTAGRIGIMRMRRDGNYCELIRSSFSGANDNPQNATQVGANADIRTINTYSRSFAIGFGNVASITFDKVYEGQTYYIYGAK